MKYEVAVYFDGPRSQWTKHLQPSEVIFRAEVPWLWFARWVARANCGNTGRCAYAITLAGETIEQRNAVPIIE